MRIVFNLHNVGLGNNGGSRTLVKSAETLCGLGHNVVLYSNIKNNYTWEKISDKVEFIKSDKMPGGDVIVATGIGSVRTTISSKFSKKYYFIRGFETWRQSKKVLLNSYRSLSCIVNSGWLQKMLRNNGIKSELVYNGLDFDDFFDLKIDKRIEMGCLFQKKPTKRYDISKGVVSMGRFSHEVLNKTIKDPTPKDLNIWYNSIMVWLATSELEGLHNPPMEASLSGCGLVCTNHPRSGASDYAIHNRTALLYKAGDIQDATNCVKMLLEDDSMREELNFNMTKLLRKKIGTRENNMKKFANILGGNHG